MTKEIIKTATALAYNYTVWTIYKIKGASYSQTLQQYFELSC